MSQKSSIPTNQTIRLLLAASVAAVVLGYSVPALAQQDYWIDSSAGLPMGPITAMDRGGEVFLVGTVGGIFRHEEEFGWVLTEIDDVRIEEMSVSPEGTFYAISNLDSLLLRSSDGVFWERRAMPGSSFGAPAVVSDSLVYAFIHGNEACDTDQNGLFLHRSQDGGQTWTCLPDLEPLSGVRDLLATDEGALLASTFQGVYRSDDGGFTWEPTTYAAGQSSSVNGDRFGGSSHGYVVVQSWIDGSYLSTDDGRTWTKTELEGVVDDIILTDDQVLYAGMREFTVCSSDDCTYYPGGLRRSSDAGHTWSPTTHREIGVGDLVVRPDGLYASSDLGLFRSIDGGESWSDHDADIKNQIVHDLTTASDGAVYVATYPRRLHVSLDGGRSWTALEPPAFNEDILDYGESDRIGVPRFWVLHAAPDGMLYAVDGNLLRSPDGGASWTEHSVGFILSDLTTAADGALLAAGGAAGVFRSTNRGESWIKVGEGDIDAHVIAEAPDGTLYAGTFMAIHTLRPGENQWTTTPLEGYRLEDIVVDGAGRALAGLSRWKEATVDGAGKRNREDALATGRSDTESFFSSTYAATPNFRPTYELVDGGGVLRSSDAGNSWEHVGLDSVRIHAIASDSYGGIYAGSYYSADGGDTWRLLGGVRGTTLALSIGPEGRIYSGTFGAGVFRSTFLAGTRIEEPPGEQRRDLVVGAAYPHPAGRSATVRIPFALDASRHVRIVVYDVLGREQAILADRRFERGEHELHWELGAVSTGTYIVRLQAGQRFASMPVVVAR